MVDVDAADREQDLGCHPDRLQLADRAEHTEIGVVVGVATELGGVGEEADVAQTLHELVVELGALGDLGERVLVTG